MKPKKEERKQEEEAAGGCGGWGKLESAANGIDNSLIYKCKRNAS